MKSTASVLLMLLTAGAAGLRADDKQELARLRAAYETKVDDARRTLMQTYLRDLEKLRDTYSRAGQSRLAKEVQAELESIQRQDLVSRGGAIPASPPKASTAKVFVGGASPPDPQWFVGKSWHTEAGLKWNFGNDGLSGDKMKGGRKVASFTWKLPETGLVELTERDSSGRPIGVTYVRFVNRSEAWAGGSANKLNLRLRPE